MGTIATRGFDDVTTHASMILDEQRMDAYRRAIDEVVRPGDVVVDVGAGSGVLSMMAAQAGARRVFAIERGPVGHLAQNLAEANGLRDVVQVIREDAREVVLPEPPTVILSETMGNFGIDEGLLSMLARIKRQCVPDVRVIPTTVEPVLCLLEHPELTQEFAALERLQGLDFRPLRSCMLHQIIVGRLAAAALASEPRETASFRVGVDSTPHTLQVRLQATRRSSINGLGGWFRSRLSPSVSIDTGPTSLPTHWLHLLMPLDPPLLCEAGDTVEVSVTPRILQGRSLWTWTARLGSEERRGDGLCALMGDAREVAAQLQGRSPSLPAVALARLELMRAALDGPLDPPGMAQRMYQAAPGRYTSVDDAEEEVWAWLHGAASLLLRPLRAGIPEPRAML